MQALSQYLSSIQVLQTGVFVKWNSVKAVTEGHEWPVYKGFYTLEKHLTTQGQNWAMITM